MENNTLKLSQWAKEVIAGHAQSKELTTEYISFIKGLGSMIIQNGLLGTLIFMEVKEKAHHKLIYEDVLKFLDWKGYKYGKEKNIQFAENEYLKISQEVLNLITWLRRYADIFGACLNDK